MDYSIKAEVNMVMLKFRGIRGVGAEFLRKCSSGSLEKNLAFPIQSLWDYLLKSRKMKGFLLSYNKSCGIWSISNQVAIQRGQVTAHGDLPSFLLILMSTEQMPNFSSERESPEDLRAFSKGRAESCRDSAPERTWQSHGPQSPAALRRPAPCHIYASPN